MWSKLDNLAIYKMKCGEKIELDLSIFHVYYNKKRIRVRSRFILNRQIFLTANLGITKVKR